MTARDSSVVPGASRTPADALAAAGSLFDDSSNSNRILTVVVVLLVLGVVLLGVSWWYWRSTRPEPDALAPLELMSSRKLRKASPEERRRALDAVRPIAAAPADGEPLVLARSMPVDLEAMSSRELPPLDELAEPVVSVSPAPSLEGVVSSEAASGEVHESSTESAAPSAEPVATDGRLRADALPTGSSERAAPVEQRSLPPEAGS